MSRLTVPSSLTLIDAVDGPLPLRHSPTDIPMPRASLGVEVNFLGKPILSLRAAMVSIRPFSGIVEPLTAVSPSLKAFFNLNSNGSIPNLWAITSVWDSVAKVISATPEAR